ncbi:radical SAM protein [Candidatus Dojkabacteria bacterium]|nr:radical SAM protein [Candidatus Dojkabacteria bacterium]
MEIKPVQAKTLLATHTKPDSWFGCKYNMNLYRGCQHKCIYCDTRSECYQIENFEKEILYKENAIELLKDELPRKRVKGTICFGSMNDEYMPIEKDLRLTRQALEVIVQHRFPVHMMTKSDLILRDLDLLKKISSIYVAATFTITASDDELSKKVEPGAPPSSARFEAIKKLSDQGIYTGITMMPILPFIEDTDENITSLIEKAHESGAKYILAWFGLTMRDRQRTHFYKKLDELFPGMKTKYRKAFGENYECNSTRIAELQSLFESLCLKYGIETKMKFYEPEKPAKQLDLLQS